MTGGSGGEAMMAGQVAGYRLSAQQRHLWRLRGRGHDSWAQCLISIDGPLEEARLTAALDAVSSRHGILRTTYREVPGSTTAVQLVGDSGERPVEWAAEDLTPLTAERRRERVAEVARGERTLCTAGEGTPVRAILFGRGPRDHALLLTLPALAADRRALRLLTADLAAAYGEALPGDDVLQYVQYAEWQHDLDDHGVPLPEEAAFPAFPLERVRRPGGGGRTHVRNHPLPPETSAALRAFADRAALRPDAILLAAWQVLLSKITGRPDIAVGACFAGREHEEMADCLGHFARWLEERAEVDGDSTFAALAAAAERSLAESEEGQEHVLTTYAVSTPEWGVAFECCDAPAAHRAAGAVFTVEWEDVESEPYGLKLECEVGAAAVRTMWRHRSERFDAGYVDCLATQYLTLLAGLLTRPDTPVRAVSPVDPDTRVRLLVDFNAVGEPASGPPACLHRLFEEQVERTPGRTALVARAAHLTYAELNARANRLAAALRARGVGPEDRVGVCAAHSANLVVALLAVLKSGGAFVPLDPETPPIRNRLLLSRAGCRILLADDASAFDWEGELVELDRPPSGVPPAEAPGPSPSPVPGPDTLAYVMFTSGSTGTPKGVMLPHRAVTNYVTWAARAYLDGAPTGTPVHSSIAFDLTVTSLFAPLISGGTVRIDPAWRDVHALSAEIERQGNLDLLKITPSHLEVIDRVLPPESLPHAARSLVLGGEALLGDAVARWLRHAPETRIFNEYGPTEAAVGCCVHEVRAEDDGGGISVPIGRPIPNAEIYVLDADGEPVPVGVPGEIYIGGECLARGYVGSPGQTADRFVPHPFSTVPGRRLYRTGDLACHGSDGELRFLGRTDDQFKVRGVRVEPGEIQSVLRTHPGVREAVVIQREGRLVAYFVPGGEVAGRDPGDATGAGLRTFLAERLPSYMVPAACVELDAIPLTPNGKVDRSALPSAGRRRRAFTPPADAMEAVVATVFEELLGVEPVGVDDDFFELGGHSILAVQLVARINEASGRDLPVSVLFEDGEPGRPETASGPATVGHLARLLADDAAGGQAGCLVPLRRRGDGMPLFCVHPAGGEVLGYRHLVSSPLLRRPVYGLQAPPLDHPEADQDVASLAARYLEEIRRLRPAGPYLLLGWSMGGLVAFEMARRLEAAGEEVSGLLLVESYLAPQLPDYDETAQLPAFADEIGALAGARIVVPQEALRGVPVGKGIELVLSAAAAEGFVPSATERDRLVDRFRLNLAHLRAARVYRPGRHSGPVTLVQASEQDAELRSAAVTTWKNVCGRLDVRTVPGGHLTLLDGGSVEAVINLIEDLADDAAIGD